MSFAFTESDAGLVYRERRSPWLRLFIGGIGAAMWLVPIPFVLHGPWRSGSPLVLAAAAGVVLPVLFGLLLFAMALGGVHEVAFDRRRRMLVRTTRAPLGRTRRTEIAFDRVERIEVVAREAVDDPPDHLLVLSAVGRRPMTLGVFRDRDEAERWRRRLEAEVAA